MTKEQLSELYKLHKSGSKLLYGIGNYPVSISHNSDMPVNYDIDIVNKVTIYEYRTFISAIGFIELHTVEEIELYLEVIKKNVR